MLVVWNVALVVGLGLIVLAGEQVGPGPGFISCEPYCSTQGVTASPP